MDPDANDIAPGTAPACGGMEIIYRGYPITKEVVPNIIWAIFSSALFFVLLMIVILAFQGHSIKKATKYLLQSRVQTSSR